ncbi:DUF1289 domain-containing protein [Bosea sp. RAF48]|uniref:DUF1289 domain-containing protein n=1 Tax=Bosea sp. RAF48 TaxID=3237480 RepID=UPI003F920CDE
MISAISTPCIKVCIIAPQNRLCEGCGRTLAEIAQWGRLSEAERLAIMAVLSERLAQGASQQPPRHARA